jgi:predicted proteasome-type protease
VTGQISTAEGKAAALVSSGNAANAGMVDDVETLQTLSSMVKNNDQNIVVAASRTLSTSQKTIDRAKVRCRTKPAAGSSIA